MRKTKIKDIAENNRTVMDITSRPYIPLGSKKFRLFANTGFFHHPFVGIKNMPAPAADALRMLGQNIHLLLKLPVVAVKIVAVQNGKELPFRLFQQRLAVKRSLFYADRVHAGERHFIKPDKIMFIRIFADDFLAAVVNAVKPDENFKVKIRFLRQNTVQSAFYVLPLVAERHQHG